MRGTLIVVGLLSQLGLAACGNLGICSNSCNPPLTHDSFCQCQDYTKLGPTSPQPGQTSSPTTASPTTASCICSYSSGIVGAWFSYQPNIYPTTNRTLKVFASGCSDLTVCERVANGDGSDSYTYLKGLVGIKPINWTRTDNLINGGTVWTLFGNVTQDQSQLEPMFTPIEVRAAKFILSTWRILENASFTNSIPACRAACTQPGAFCEFVNLDRSQVGSLKALKTRLSGNANTLSSKDLLSLFHLTEDPCHRSDTTLINGKVENTGDACVLKAAATDVLGSVELHMPGVLSGTIRRDDGMISVDFPYSETRGRVHFSDDDLESDWGGEIKSAWIDDSAAGFSVGSKSCLKVPLD